MSLGCLFEGRKKVGKDPFFGIFGRRRRRLESLFGVRNPL